MTAKEIEAGEPVETTQAVAPLTKGEKFKRHCARRWILWLIGVLILIIVLIITLIFGIIPAVAQSTLDKTTLNVQSINILDPTPEKFRISLVSHITGGGSIARKAKLDPMDVNFSLKDQQPFLTVPIPGVKGGDDIVVEVDNYTATIQNADTFGQFASTLMGSQEFTMDVNGKTKLRLGSLKANVKYRETVTLKGLNKLQGMIITDYTLVLTEPDHNLHGKVLIPNPSVFTIQTGDVPLVINFNGSSLGTGALPNLILTPGLENKYGFKAKLDSAKLTNAMSTVISGKAVLEIRANGALFNGVDIPWLSKPLGNLTTNVPVKALSLG